MLASVLGAILAKILGCKSGIDYVHNCSISSLDEFISNLLPMAWFMFITLPIGVISGALLFIIWFINNFRK